MLAVDEKEEAVSGEIINDVPENQVLVGKQ